MLANQLAGETPQIAGEVFNIACGEQITVKDVLTDIAAQMNCNVVPRYEPARLGDVRHSRADIAAAQARLLYSPTVLFADGLKKTVSSFVAGVSGRG